MLQRVRNDDRSDGRRYSSWSESPGDYHERSNRMENSGRNFPDRYRHDQRRSVAGRVALTVLLAAALMSAAGAAYVAGRSGSLDAVLARMPGPTLSTASDDSSTTMPPAAPTVAQQAQRQPPAAPEQLVPPPMPDVQGLVILIRNAILALHQANTTGNYSVLREVAAPGFQQANTPASMSEAFAELRSRGIDLGQIAVVNPRLREEPVINELGLLRMNGFFPAGSEQVDFELLFQGVGGRWRLFGISLQPPDVAGGRDTAPKSPQPKAAAGAMPDSLTMIALIRGAVIALNQANMAGDYSVLRDFSAPGFQQANSLAQLGTIFAQLRARQLDLGPVAVIDPRLFRPPAIDQRGFLRLTGYFPSRPEQVNFDLAFQFVDDHWRLFGIGLNTSRQVTSASMSASPEGSATGQAKDDPGAVAPVIAKPEVAAPPAPRLRP